MCFITVNKVFWLVVGAAVVHVLEEYFKGFIDQMKSFAPESTKQLFIIVNVVNALFIILCILAAIINKAIPFFSLSIAGLLFINAEIHIYATVRHKKYAPGLVSAVLLYIPLGFYAYYLYNEAGLLTLSDFTFGSSRYFVAGITTCFYRGT